MKTALAAALSLAVVSAAAAPPSPVADLKDPAFDRYVDLAAVGVSWDAMDPALLTDVTLQLAEGERVLRRPHKALPADELFAFTTRLAAEKGDEASLDRLTKAAERSGRNAWTQQVAAAKKLGSAARSTDPLSVPIADITPRQFEALWSSTQTVAAARLTGDAAALDDLEGRLDILPLRPEDRATVERLIAEAREALPQTIDPTRAATGKALSRLAAASRGCDLMTGLGCGT